MLKITLSLLFSIITLFSLNSGFASELYSIGSSLNESVYFSGESMSIIEGQIMEWLSTRSISPSIDQIVYTDNSVIYAPRCVFEDVNYDSISLSALNSSCIVYKSASSDAQENAYIHRYDAESLLNICIVYNSDNELTLNAKDVPKHILSTYSGVRYIPTLMYYENNLIYSMNPSQSTYCDLSDNRFVHFKDDTPVEIDCSEYDSSANNDEMYRHMITIVMQDTPDTVIVTKGNEQYILSAVNSAEFMHWLSSSVINELCGNGLCKYMPLRLSQGIIKSDGYDLYVMAWADDSVGIQDDIAFKTIKLMRKENHYNDKAIFIYMPFWAADMATGMWNGYTIVIPNDYSDEDILEQWGLMIDFNKCDLSVFPVCYDKEGKILGINEYGITKTHALTQDEGYYSIHMPFNDEYNTPDRSIFIISTPRIGLRNLSKYWLAAYEVDGECINNVDIASVLEHIK